MGENKREKVFLEFPIIETERFILKEIEEKHKNHFISLFSDEDIMKYSGTEVYDPEKQVEFYFKKVKLMYKEKKGNKVGYNK